MEKYISSYVKMMFEKIGKLELSHINRMFEKIGKKHNYDLSHIDRKLKALAI